MIRNGALKVRVSSDLDEAEKLWNRFQPAADIFSLWCVRRSFHESFDRPLLLLVAEEGQETKGFIPLSHIEEEGYFGAFPGETWNGRTWLEQNVIGSASPMATKALWEAAPEDTVIRYVAPSSAIDLAGAEVDETGYIFRPADYGYDYERYLNEFSGKSRKRMSREIESLGSLEIGPSSRVADDIEWMFRMNVATFGKMSYFSDRRFIDGFEKMISELSGAGMLVVTTASVKGVRAAVDIGAVNGSFYTVLAGAASPQFPGIAKAINLYHIRLSCREKYMQTDFLCGDFGWKARFHLSPRPLFIMSKESGAAASTSEAERVEGCA